MLASERRGREERREEGREGRGRKEEGERMRPDPNGVCLKAEVWGAERETQKCLGEELKEFSRMFFDYFHCCLFECNPTHARVMCGSSGFIRVCFFRV